MFDVGLNKFIQNPQQFVEVKHSQAVVQGLHLVLFSMCCELLQEILRHEVQIKWLLWVYYLINYM